MASVYLQKLALCGQLQLKRDPIVHRVATLLFANPGGLSLDAIVANISTSFGYTSVDIIQAIVTFTQHGLFYQHPGSALYTIHPQALHMAPFNKTILVYFNPNTQFPSLMDSHINCGFPYSPTTYKGMHA